jgi:hypothetical protein
MAVGLETCTPEILVVEDARRILENGLVGAAFLEVRKRDTSRKAV